MLNKIKYIVVVIVAVILSVKTAQAVTPTSVRRAAPTITPTPIKVVKPEGGINMSLTPIFINLTTEPGQTVNSSVKIRNNSNFTEYLHIRVAKFTAEAGGERLTIVDMAPEDQFNKWISFDQNQFVLGPLDTKTIHFTINVPKSAALGYYYALVFERLEENIPEIKSETYVVGAPVLPVLLDVHSPLAKREVQLVDVKTDKLFYEYLPVEFEVKVKNSGNIHVVPDGNIFIDWGGSKDIAILNVNTSKSNVLPQTTRVYTASWSDGMIVREEQRDEQGEFLRDKKGNKIIKTVTHFDKADRFRFGRYIAHVLLIYDNGQRDVPIEATVSFWVIPWKILLVSLVVLYFVIVGLKDTIVNQFKKFRSRFGRK